MHKFDFSYDEYQNFLNKCPFTADEIKILEMRRKGASLVEMQITLNTSGSSIDRIIKSIVAKISKEI